MRTWRFDCAVERSGGSVLLGLGETTVVVVDWDWRLCLTMETSGYHCYVDFL